MVVPFGESNYYSFTALDRDPKPESGNLDAAINLDGFFGLHPSMSAFKPLWDSKQLAIVHAAGSPDNTRSHFDAQDYMESATPGVKSTSDGWLNRYLHSKKDPERSLFRAVSMTEDNAARVSGTRACRGDVEPFGLRDSRRQVVGKCAGWFRSDLRTRER